MFLVTEDCPVQEWAQEEIRDPVLDLGPYASNPVDFGERLETPKAVEVLPTLPRGPPGNEGHPMPSVTSLCRPKGSVLLPEGMGFSNNSSQQGAYAAFAAASRPRHMGAYTDGEPPRMDETTKALQAIAKAVTSKDEAASHDKGSWHLLGR